MKPLSVRLSGRLALIALLAVAPVLIALAFVGGVVAAIVGGRRFVLKLAGLLRDITDWLATSDLAARANHPSEVARVAERTGALDATAIALGGSGRERDDADRTYRGDEARRRFALQAAAVGVWEICVETRRVYWSETCEVMHGVTPGQFGGTIDDMAATLHPDDRELLNEMTSAPISSPAERNLEYRTIWPDGTIHRINLRGQVKLDADGKSVRGAGVVLDVTERRLLEEQLRQTLKLEAVGQLAGGIAHDFNNLLTIITGNTQLALETLPDASVVQEDLEHALVAAERAAQLTRQLLAFSRRQILRTEPVDIANLVDEITPLLQRLVGEDVGVTTKTIGANVVTIADRAELEQALINLVINSRDAMPSGGALNIVTKAIRLDAMAIGRQRLDLDPGDYVEMRVTDSGTGMSPDVLARAIEPFFSTKVIGKGSGLGLPSAYGTVKQIGGHLRIESTIGHGTTVTIVLPRAAAVETPQALPMGECDAVDGNLATILLMENDAALNERTRKAVGLAS